MPKHLKIAEHLSAEDLERAYRGATDPVARSQWQIVWLLAGGQSTAQVAAVTGYCVDWIRVIAHRYNQAGPAGVGDRRHRNPGAKRLLTAEQEQELAQALDGPAPGRLDEHAGGAPAGPRAGLGSAAARGVHERPAASTPHPSRSGRPGGVQKGGLAEQVSQVQHACPAARVAVWGTDQHRVGLKPILRRVWYRRGQRPIALVRPRYQWLYVYAFVHPASGQTFWLLLPTVSVAHFSRALAEFATAVGVGPDLQVVLVLDQAGWHRSRQVELPAGLTLVFLPPYSPELQPAERLWALSDQPLANRSFPDLEALEAVQAERCRALQAHPEWIQGPTHFHWWPEPLQQPPAA